MQLSVDEVKRAVESMLWNGGGNLLWGFCYQQQVTEGVMEDRRAGYAVRLLRPPTELTVVATGLYCILDPDYKPILIGEQDPWPGYKLRNEVKGVEPGAWREAIRNLPPEESLIKSLYSDLLERMDGIYKDKSHNEAIHVLPWVQSPVDTLSALYTPWRFLEELTFNEASVLKDLDFVTDFTIQFIKLLQKSFPHLTPYCLEKEVWMPDGISLWEDQMDIFSRFLPEGYYESFSMPFTRRIALEFGGVALHTCGEVTDRVLEPLGRYEELIAFQYDAAQTPTRRVLDALGDRKLALIPRYSFAGIDKELRPNTQIQYPLEYVRSMADDWHRQPRMASMFLVVPQTIDSLLDPGYVSAHGSPHGGVNPVIQNREDLDKIFETLKSLDLLP